MIRDTTSAMPTRSTRSVEEVCTIPSRHSVVTTWSRLGADTVAMLAVVITVPTTRAPSFVSAAKCTRNAACCLIIPSRIFAAQNTWCPRLVEAILLAVSHEAMIRGNTSATEVNSFLCAGRSVTTQLARSAVIP